MLPATKASFAKALEGLIKKFEADQDTYLSPGYGEAQARTHFITPFFKALGWDVENEAGVPYHLCEVWEEKGETEGRPDYTFRLNGRTKFFIEAKAPSVSLGSPGPILQTKSYAWNSKDVLLAGLTHFEEFRFFDASLEPDERRVLDGEAFHLQWTEYVEKIDLLWELSPERVLQGSLDQFLRRDRKSIRYRVPVDERFLDELTEWRHELASNIHRLNSTVDATQLNDIVQRLLDRIVFLRIAEERKVIESGQLRELVELWEQRAGKVPIMQDLVSLFSEINDDFNGEIFKPHPCEKVKIDSSLLAKIIRRLYPPRSPYRFDVIGVELLGSIYERYLGNTLSVTAKQVRLELKPEVRHAGGVFYTPKFIVDYIVKNTVGNLVNGKTPKEVEKVRILDPACGSGSFLIGAFQFLIDWHLAYYHEHPKEANLHPMYPEIVKDLDGSERLSFHAKIRIMRQNLYGIDIDQQAVEITMMSLYLKALEAEKGMLAPKKELLPELKYNIQCGNSLIGPEIEKESRLTNDLRARMRPFDWHSREDGFGDILAAGGFHCVIGNPPYVRIQDLAEWAPEEAEHYKEQFASAQHGNFDLYIIFLEKGLSVLADVGLLGFIVPRKFMQATYGEGIRKLLTTGDHVKSITNFSNNQVFEDSFVNTCVILLSKKPAKTLQHIFVPKLDHGLTLSSVLTSLESGPSQTASIAALPPSSLTSAPWILASLAELKLLDKLRKGNSNLENFTERIFQGLKTGADKIYIVESRQSSKNTIDVFSKHTGRVHKLETTLLKTLIKGGDSDRFCIKTSNLLILFPYQQTEADEVSLVEEKYLKRKLPLTYDYLREVKSYLEARENGITKGHGWYSYTRSQNIDVIGLPKIITPDLAEKSSFSLDTTGKTFFVGGAAGGYGILPKSSVDPRYLLGLLNSKVVDWFIQTSGTQMESGYYSYEARFIRSAPIPRLDASDKHTKKLHDRIVVLVDFLLKSYQRKCSGTPRASELQGLEREIEAAEVEIDGLVYELYGITDEERKIIQHS